MSEFLCVGLSHKSAPLAVRERFALTAEDRAQLLRAVVEHASGEAMIVSTCNRVELYLATGSAERAAVAVRLKLSSIGGPESAAHLYEHHGEAALLQLFRVAASLDSMVVGEPQILGQVKDAFELGQKTGTVRGELSRACAAAFGSAKRVRTETEIGKAASSMASAAVSLASKIFGGLKGRAVLLVGAGEMGEIAARHLATSGAGPLVVTSRTRARADALAATVGGTAADFSELSAQLQAADLVVCSTASMHPIFTPANVQPVLKARKHRPLFMVDLAVPRDIDPAVHALEGVYAYDVDDIQKVLADNAAARLAEAGKAEAIVAQELARFLQSRAVREGVPVLAQLRARAEQIARAEIERTLGNLGELSPKQRKSIEAMGLAIVNKLLHQPTSKLRAVGSDQAPNHLAGAAAELFGLTLHEVADAAADDEAGAVLALAAEGAEQ